MKSKNYLVIIISALVLGLVAAFARSYELAYGFDAISGLPIGDRTLPVMVYIVSAIFAAALIVFGIHTRKSVGAPADGARVGIAVVSGITGAILLAVAGMIIYECVAVKLEIAELIYAILTVYAAASIIIIGVKRLNSLSSGAYNVCAAVPVFWACYSLILIFREKISDPVIPDYIYLLFSFICVLLFTYSVAAYVFGKNRIGTAVLSGGLGIFFILIEVVAPVFAMLAKPDFALSLEFIAERLPLIAFLPFIPCALSVMLKNSDQADNS